MRPLWYSPNRALSMALVCSNLPVGTSYSAILDSGILSLAPLLVSRPSHTASIFPSGENRMSPEGLLTDGSGLGCLLLGLPMPMLAALRSVHTAWASGLINPPVAGEPSCLPVTASHLLV